MSVSCEQADAGEPIVLDVGGSSFDWLRMGLGACLILGLAACFLRCIFAKPKAAMCLDKNL
jgi:hypothetical protein